MRRFFHFGAVRAVPAPVRDELGEHVAAAIAADEAAIVSNAQTYEARVEAMIGDFFVKYGESDVRHRS